MTGSSSAGRGPVVRLASSAAVATPVTSSAANSVERSRSRACRRPRPASAPAAAAVSPITRSAAPCTSVRASARRGLREQRGGGDRAQRPAERRAGTAPPRSGTTRPSAPCRTAAATRAARRRRADSTGGRPNRSAAQPTSGANANMPSTCTLITTPMISSVGAAVVHVQRGHHHHRDHHRVRQGQRGRRRPPPRAASRTTSTHPRPDADAGRATAAGERRLPGDQQRVGAQEHRDHARRRRSIAGSAEHERAGQRAGRPSGRPARPATPVRFGPATAPIVVAQTTIESARARWRRPGQVGGGVARLVVRGGRRAEQRGPDQQQRERPDHAGDHAERGAERRRAGSRARARAAGPAGPSACASRNDATAAPSTCMVCARPASFSLPETCSASSAATAMPMRDAEPAEGLRGDQRPDRAALHLRDPVVRPAHAAVHAAGQPTRPADPAGGRRRPPRSRRSSPRRQPSRSQTARQTRFGSPRRQRLVDRAVVEVGDHLLLGPGAGVRGPSACSIRAQNSVCRMPPRLRRRRREVVLHVVQVVARACRR